MAWLCFWYRIAKHREIIGISKEHPITFKVFGGTGKMRMSAFIMHSSLKMGILCCFPYLLYSQCQQVLSYKKQLFGHPTRRISIKFVGRLRTPHKSLRRTDKFFCNIMNQS